MGFCWVVHNRGGVVSVPNRSGFVGRQRELALLRKGLEGLQRRVPMIVSIVGEAGIGKTTLVTEMLNDAAELRSSGFRIAKAGAVEHGGAPAYWLWSEVLRQLDLAWQIDFSNLGIASADPSTRSLLEFQLFEEVTECIRRSAREHPLLIVFEDFQWADEETCRLLSHFVRGLEGVGIGLIVTHGDEMGDRSEAADGALLQIARTSGSESIRLLPFNEEEIAAVFHGLSEGVGSDRLEGRPVGEMLARTGGNPMFVTELARSIAAGSIDGLPRSIQMAVGDRFDSLDRHTVEVLETASLAPGPFTPAVVNRLVESLPFEQVQDAFDQAVDARFLIGVSGLSDTWDFRHAIVREVVASRITGKRRVQVHAKYMDVLEVEYRNALDVHAEEIVYHGERARPLIDDARLVRYLMFAARMAMKSLAFERAAARFTRVIELAEAEVVDDSLAEAMRGIVVAGSGSGRDEEIAGYFGRAFRYYVSNGFIDLAVEIAQIRFIDTEGMSGGIEVYEAALELVEPDSREEASVLSRLGRSVGMIQGDYSRAKRLLDRGVEIARALGDGKLEMQLCGDGINAAHFCGEYASAREFCERVEELADETSDPLSEGGAFLHLGLYSLSLGETARGFGYLQRSLQRSIDSHVSERISSAHKVLAAAYIRTCDWESAISQIRSALEHFPGDERVLGLRATVEAMMGESGAFEATVTEFLETPESRRDSGEAASTRYLQMACRVELGDERARAEVQRSIMAIESRSKTTRMLDSALVLGRACLALEGAGTADEYMVIREHLLGLGLPDAELAYLPGISSLAGLVEEADCEFDRMIAGAVDRSELFNEAWLRCDCAAHLIRHGRGETAIARAVAQGRRVADRGGIVGLQAKYDRLELVVSGRKVRTAGLTRRELEILRLLYSGKSNPEIAEELVVSRHTVVRHVSNVFAKPEVSNRAEASRAAVELGLVCASGTFSERSDVDGWVG